MKTVNISGKEYVMVHERIKFFRDNEAYKDWQINTELLEITEEWVVCRAEILNDLGITVATGHASERKGDGFINKTSYVENCETSAWGRALACLGIGIDDSMASADEVGNAIKQQSELPWMNQKDFEAMSARLKDASKDKKPELLQNIYKSYKVKKFYRDKLEA